VTPNSTASHSHNLAQPRTTQPRQRRANSLPPIALRLNLLPGRAVVITSGIVYRRLGVPELEPLVGAGVFYGAATVEAQAVAGQPVFVVGGGNSAGQAALHLAKSAQQVTILVRSDSPLVRFATSALAAFCAGLTGTASSGGAPSRLPNALRRTMDNALNGT
jgi:hypothetical protein